MRDRGDSASLGTQCSDGSVSIAIPSRRSKSVDRLTTSREKRHRATKNLSRSVECLVERETTSESLLATSLSPNSVIASNLSTSSLQASSLPADHTAAGLHLVSGSADIVLAPDEEEMAALRRCESDRRVPATR